MITKPYFSYLIRIWRDEGSLPASWLVSLEDPHNKQIVYFKSMKDLFTFLRERSMLEEHKLAQQTKD